MGKNKKPNEQHRNKNTKTDKQPKTKYNSKHVTS